MDSLLNRCVGLLKRLDVEAYLVGGIVRDLLLRRARRDIDLAVRRDALALARRIADELGGSYFPLDADRETGRIVMPDRYVIDVALLRGGKLESDLAERDFTINAMALPIDRLTDSPEPSQIIDPHGGIRDLRRQVLRAVGMQSFVSDSVRLLRAVRLAGELGLTLEPDTRRLIERDAHLLSEASAERQRDELARILEMHTAAGMIRCLADLQLLPQVLPHAEVTGETLAAVGRTDRFASLLDDAESYEGESDPGLGPLVRRFGALLRDRFNERLSGERSRKVVLKLFTLCAGAHTLASDLKRLHFSRLEIGVSIALARHRDRLFQVARPITPLEVHRYFRDTGPVGLDLIALAAAQASGENRDAVMAAAEGLLESYAEAYDRVVEPTPLLNGAQLARQFNLSGPAIGHWLNRLREAQVRGDVRTAGDAVQFLESALAADL